jgi:ABC-type dipeptide/oligopeptide/nickel transport system ATPase component
MGVVSQMATRVAVMYAGQIVEGGRRPGLFGAPLHPYSIALLEAMPPPPRAASGSRPFPARFPRPATSRPVAASMTAARSPARTAQKTTRPPTLRSISGPLPLRDPRPVPPLPPISSPPFER